MAILVSGGAGFIGSHTCVELLNAGYEVVVVDNLVNASKVSIQRIEEITGKKLKFYELDCIDKEGLSKVFKEENIEAAIHFAGLKAVGESVQKPLEYYYNNINSGLILCEVMRENDCKKLVFSSSATVYGTPKSVPVSEESPMGEITNPYGRTKAMLCKKRIYKGCHNLFRPLDFQSLFGLHFLPLRKSTASVDRKSVV